MTQPSAGIRAIALQSIHYRLDDHRDGYRTTLIIGALPQNSWVDLRFDAGKTDWSFRFGANPEGESSEAETPGIPGVSFGLGH